MKSLKLGTALLLAGCLGLSAPAQTNTAPGSGGPGSTHVLLAIQSPGITTTRVDHGVTTELSALVPVPEPTEKAVRFYRSGIRWWLVSVAWSWFVPALVLFTGFSS